MAVKIIVNDTSCLIDLRKGGLLTTALLLPFRFVVALPLIATELNDFDESDWHDLKKRGLQIVDLDAEQVRRAFELKAEFPALSANDCFSLALSESTENAILLTGDAQLRKQALALHVDVHGVLWISDQIEKERKMPLEDLADALAHLEADPLVFLPRDELKIRIEQLRKRVR